MRLKQKNLLLVLVVLLSVFSYFSIQYDWQEIEPIAEPAPSFSPLPVLGEQIVASSSPSSPPSTVSAEIALAETAVVKRIVDGDTIELADGRKVRYIGIDTPETKAPNAPVECFGAQASEFNRQLVEGQTIQLEKDISETDHYGRLLRYVYRGEELINETLVRQGYAQVSSYPPDISKQALFQEAESDARLNNRGLWSSCPL